MTSRQIWSAFSKPFTRCSTTTTFASARFLRRQQWICRDCLYAQRNIGRRKASTFNAESTNGYLRAQQEALRQRFQDPKERRKVAIAATVIFIAGASALAFSENARFAFVAAERSGRVGITLALCVRDYRNVLKKHDDPNYDQLLATCHKRCAERTLHAMEKNGSIFIKLGQHLSSLNYLLPTEWCDTFIPLQDKCPISSFSSVEEMVRLDTGKELGEYFETFESRPIGAASLAQVHVATLKGTGEKVAVKVQHPSLDDWAKLDLALTRWSFRTLKRWFPEYDLTWLSDEMQVSLPKELDFREEGQNAERAKQYFSRVPNSPLIIPSVKWAQRRILVMEYVTGHRLDDLEYLDANGIDRDEVAAALARVFNEMIFGAGAPLHCDPHGGNLAIRLNENKRRPRNFDVILYDHGLYRDIPIQIRRDYAHLWLAVIDADEPQMRKYAEKVAGITNEQFPLFASAITGRDYSVVRDNVATSRNSEEKENISSGLTAGMLEDLIGILGQVPRIILLILKTNDLTRSLNENLHTRQGPVRSFMILARYAARAVLEEQLEAIRGSLFVPSNFIKWTEAIFGYAKVAVKLRIYELYLSARRRLGMPVELL
ncbi:ABC1-domain-containing protein [Polychaeton citri CBS 116435]|uniref:ABC1-domain-containing protein n=1 Tax=Polychaeton citri CBS 116435 TaxID=1314669 RepID=A0A9P4QB31_9PEZI|nr:ABC1-domain-containing protein [Polychaeton citri CBS 116435]